VDAHQFPKPLPTLAKTKNNTPEMLTLEGILTFPDHPLQVCLFDMGPAQQESDIRK